MKINLDNCIELVITKTYFITHFEIYNIILKPRTSGLVQVYFYDDNLIRYQRDFLLIDTEESQDYSNWLDDSYLYTYVNTHFERIFNK